MDLIEILSLKLSKNILNSYAYCWQRVASSCDWLKIEKVTMFIAGKGLLASYWLKIV